MRLTPAEWLTTSERCRDADPGQHDPIGLDAIAETHQFAFGPTRSRSPSVNVPSVSATPVAGDGHASRTNQATSGSCGSGSGRSLRRQSPPARPSAARAHRNLSDGNAHSLLVIDDGGQLEGIITTTDLIRHLAGLASPQRT